MKDIEDCCKRNYKGKKVQLGDPVQIERFRILKNFVNNEQNSISIGCGSYEPLLIGTTNACDIAPIAGTYLREQGFNGSFIVADARNLPFQYQEFNIAICSEVIEHMETYQEVFKVIKEVIRVSKTFLITTPAGFSPDPDHKFHFDEKDMKFILKGTDYFFIRHDFFFYITNDKERLLKSIQKN